MFSSWPKCPLQQGCLVNLANLNFFSEINLKNRLVSEVLPLQTSLEHLQPALYFAATRENRQFRAGGQTHRSSRRGKNTRAKIFRASPAVRGPRAEIRRYIRPDWM
jgi:hypothetical protein